MSPAVAFRKAAQLLEDDQCLGCCAALIIATNSANTGLRLARTVLPGLIGYEAPEGQSLYTYWWPVSFTGDDVTPRVIALELAALLSEEDELLSKSRKR